MLPPAPAVSSFLAIKRYTWAARIERDRPKRHQRRCPTAERAVSLAQSWQDDPDVKAVWAFGPDGAELYQWTRPATD